MCVLFHCCCEDILMGGGGHHVNVKLKVKVVTVNRSVWGGQ